MLVNCWKLTKIYNKAEHTLCSVLFYFTFFAKGENYLAKFYEKIVKITKKYLKC